MQTKPKFTGTAGGERCCGAIVGKPTKPHRACYGARSRPLLPWELLGGSGDLAAPLQRLLHQLLLQLTPHRADRGRRQSYRGLGAGADRRRSSRRARRLRCCRRICRFGANPCSLFWSLSVLQGGFNMSLRGSRPLTVVQGTWHWW